MIKHKRRKVLFETTTKSKSAVDIIDAELSKVGFQNYVGTIKLTGVALDIFRALNAAKLLRPK